MLKKIEEMVIFRHITTPLSSTGPNGTGATGVNGTTGINGSGNGGIGGSSDTRLAVIADPLYKDDNEYRKSGTYIAVCCMQ